MPSRTVCSRCDQAITPVRSPGVRCSGSCGNSYHFDCVDPILSPETIAAINLGSAEWRCSTCAHSRSGSALVSPLGSLEELMSLIGDLTTRIRSLESTNKELMERVLQLSAAEVRWNRAVSGLLAENSALTHRVGLLETTVLRLDGSVANRRDTSSLQLGALASHVSGRRVSGEVSFRDALSLSGIVRDISPIRSDRVGDRAGSPAQGLDADRTSRTRSDPQTQREIVDPLRSLTGTQGDGTRPDVPPLPGSSGGDASGRPPGPDPAPTLDTRRKKRRKPRGRDLIMGTGSVGTEESALRAAPLPESSGLAWVYVTRVHLDVTHDILRRHVMGLGFASPVVVSVKLPRQRQGSAVYSAYRVGVPRDSVDRLLVRDAWPDGIRVGRWFFRGRLPAIN